MGRKYAGHAMRWTAGLFAAAVLAGCGGDPEPIPRIDPVLVGPREEKGASGNVAATRSGAGTASRASASSVGSRRAAAPGVRISDEQDFDAVASRETIESDAYRLARQRRGYLLILPRPLPKRSERAGPSVVRYALSTTHPPGRKFYRRRLFLRPFRDDHAANCAKYASSDLAQEAFLSLGGPAKDRRNLDPDGDGYACGWDPERFREVVRR